MGDKGRSIWVSALFEGMKR